MTREETAQSLKISLSTLWHWSKKGILPSYGIGNRVYYKRSEIENSLIRINSIRFNPFLCCFLGFYVGILLLVI
ncbi:helix-turn-helix domain-containing protein [uncultured Eudoraea sp.]|uniref:helix-turn-helix domain-containing protein n=1 Tax=uncultured Eudoraea sp. TaxID=1035614 RepID=UPI002628A8D6|nr:helix-turn-helix domain-containing protein [uncultured Eudoraea sp.]